MRGSMLSRFLLPAACGALLLGGLASPAAAQATSGGQNFLHPVSAPRIADPKLDGGGVELTYVLGPAGGMYRVVATLQKGAVPVATIFDGMQRGSGHPVHLRWDGRNDIGVWVDPGSYAIRVDASSGTRTETITWPLDLVRLGIVRIEAQNSAPGATNEWQMVYFRKRARYQFFATPATGEFLSIADTGEVSDLDLDNGDPRPAPTVNRRTDQPVLEQTPAGDWAYDDDSYNYPLCYLKGARPQLEVTFGDDCTNGSGVAGGVNYPVPGFTLRCVAIGPNGTWDSSNVDLTPGGTAVFRGPPLSAEVRREVRQLVWRWQYQPAGTHAWHDVPGSLQTTHRFYTVYDTPYFADTGVQYSGPWVEVAEYMDQWRKGTGIVPLADTDVMELVVKGFFGQVGTLPTAIEGVVYDCPWNGGDGGATYYYDWSQRSMNLARLLDDAALGQFVNCSDCAAGTSVIAGMMGIQGVQMMRLGSMRLRAIWGIGSKEYTLDLWKNGGGSGHSFSYHHIITRDGGSNVSDACLCVDEDGNPDALPGTPGWNHDRAWPDYESLLAWSSISWNLDPLPKLK